MRLEANIVRAELLCARSKRLETYWPAESWTVDGSVFLEPTPWPPALGNTRRPVSSDIRLASAWVFSVTVRAFIVEVPLVAMRVASPGALEPPAMAEVRPGTATTTTWSTPTGAEAGTTTLAV